MSAPSALDALQVLARSEVEVHRDGSGGLRHLEMYTLSGLLTVLWHEPPGEARPSAIVCCGGAMGGLLGPGHGLYHRLGVDWAARGVPVLRVGYREPNDLDRCTHDAACAVELAVGAGAERVVVMGHSFGGAVAVRTGVVMPEVAGVVTFATQSAGCEVAAGLQGRPLLLFHGDRDELLPLASSEIVAAMAGRGEVVVLPGDGHLLARSDDVILDRLDTWLPALL
jgi:pimeloyl-ACP methyl ester carboxylesterase